MVTFVKSSAVKCNAPKRNKIEVHQMKIELYRPKTIILQNYIEYFYVLTKIRMKGP